LAFSDLEQGTHNVELQGLGDACFTSGENPKEVSVSAGDTTHVEFKIGCEEKPLLTGKLVFSSDSTGNSELFMMNPDGSGMEQITQTSMGEIEPAISPGGSRIAYVKGSQIFVMDADGSNDIQLTDTYKNGGNGLHDSYHISWSPDGNKLLFISNRDDNEEIYIMNKDGSNPVNLTRNAAEDYISTDAWSPDGTRIVFWSNRSQNGIFDIYTMNPDGSDVRKLTNSKYNDMGAAWSPAGGRMVFSSDRDWNAELYLMNTDGSNIKRMTDHPDPDVSPVWSPDGNKIAFLSMIEGDQYKYDIFILDLSTGLIKDLTPDGYYKYNERDVDWSPIK